MYYDTVMDDKLSPNPAKEGQYMLVEWVDVDTLSPNPRNPNRHSKAQIKRLSELIKYQGWRLPIIVSKQSGNVVAGHGRLDAARVLGVREVPVTYQDFVSPEVEYAFLVSDNAIHNWSELDLSSINSFVPELGPDFDIELLGLKDFTIEVADKLPPGCDEDEVPDHVEAKTKLGDIFSLGDHHLLCGDSTNILHVERLMNGCKADVLLTDPPYGVSYTEKNEWLNSIGPGHRLTNAIENDSKPPNEMNEFWFTALSNAYAVLAEKCSYYICSPQGGDLMMMMSILRAGFQLKHMLIWVKNNHVLGRCDYNYKHEPILYGWKKNGTHEFHGNGRCKTSIWDFNRPHKSDLHPTMKPVELMEEAILNSTTGGGTVLDLFGGSGSTLIACEKNDRKCFMSEISPHYCDVIISRYEKFSGKKVTLCHPDACR